MRDVHSFDHHLGSVLGTCIHVLIVPTSNSVIESMPASVASRRQRLHVVIVDCTTSSIVFSAAAIFRHLEEGRLPTTIFVVSSKGTYESRAIAERDALAIVTIVCRSDSSKLLGMPINSCCKIEREGTTTQNKLFQDLRKKNNSQWSFQSPRLLGFRVYVFFPFFSFSLLGCSKSAFLGLNCCAISCGISLKQNVEPSFDSSKKHFSCF